MLIVVSVPSCRERLFRRSEREVSRKQAWALVILGLVLLPASFVFMSSVVSENENNNLLTIFGLIAIVIAFGALLWRFGFSQDSGIRINRFWLAAIFIYQTVIVAMFIGKVPYMKLAGEVWNLGSAYKQYHDISSFISISPERNADTWMHFFATWPFLGVYQGLFGVGIFQARFFYLLLGWLATPFLYLTVKHLYGKTSAYFTAIISILIPLHFNWSVSYIWVSTASAIALYYLFLFLHTHHCRPRIHLFLCGLFITSAIDGHPYGGAFIFMLAIVLIWELISNKEYSRKNVYFFLGYFFLGVSSYCLIYFFYHIVLPGVSIFELPQILQDTLSWERGLGEAALGVGFTYRNLWKMAQLYMFTNVFEFVILVVIVIYMCLSRNKAEKILLVTYFGSFVLIFSQLAHVNEFYWVFTMPFISIGFGAFSRALGVSLPKGKIGKVGLSFGGVFVLLTVLITYTLQAYQSANDVKSKERWDQTQTLAAIGREINLFLSNEDIVIAGDGGYYLGMPERLNYWTSFSFTWEIPKYWPLDPPQAIIVTLGQDEGYSGLAEWLVEHEFQAIECYPLASNRTEAKAAILYTLPELNVLISQENCTPEMLTWLAAYSSSRTHIVS